MIWLVIMVSEKSLRRTRLRDALELIVEVAILDGEHNGENESKVRCDYDRSRISLRADRVHSNETGDRQRRARVDHSVQGGLDARSSLVASAARRHLGVTSTRLGATSRPFASPSQNLRQVSAAHARPDLPAA
jgi:hypothetical protein